MGDTPTAGIPRPAPAALPQPELVVTAPEHNLSNAAGSLAVRVCGYSAIEVCVGDANLRVFLVKQEFKK